MLYVFYWILANNSISNGEVQYIIDSVVSELQKDENRRFIYVEMSFFTRWWNEQNDETREITKDFVNQGGNPSKRKTEICKMEFRTTEEE